MPNISFAKNDTRVLNNITELNSPVNNVMFSNENYADDGSKNKVVDLELLKKDDDEFSKLEALFIQELSLSESELPTFAQLSIEESLPPPPIMKHQSSTKKIK